MARVCYLVLEVGGRLAPFYIHEMNQVNPHNYYAMMTAP